jgi:hypothetical protein
VSEIRHLDVQQLAVTVSPRFTQEGSILADTVSSRLAGIDTTLEIATSAPREAVEKLIRTAERMCFVLDAVRERHEVRTRTIVNGQTLV